MAYKRFLNIDFIATNWLMGVGVGRFMTHRVGIGVTSAFETLKLPVGMYVSAKWLLEGNVVIVTQ